MRILYLGQLKQTQGAQPLTVLANQVACSRAQYNVDRILIVQYYYVLQIIMIHVEQKSYKETETEYRKKRKRKENTSYREIKQTNEKNYLLLRGN